MKKILSVNLGSKKFREEYSLACQNLKITSDNVRSCNCYFVLSNTKAVLFHKDQEINPTSYSYLFIRVAGKYKLMTSLIAHFFNFYTVPLSDNGYLEHTENEEKITQMLVFALNGIPIPSSILFTIDGFNENKENILSHFSFPCVLKTNGSQGRNVWKIENKESLESRIESLDLSAEVVMIQEFIPNNFDIRVLFMHGDIIGAISRSSSDGFLNNVSSGAMALPIEITKEESQLAVRACLLLGRTFAGVDIVRAASGPYLFEVNNGPQVYGFEAATKINVPLELLKRINDKFLK